MEFSEYRDLLIKLILAFLIPLSWVSILHPLKNKIKKSWYGLIISLSIVSFFIMVLKEVMDNVFPLFDEIITYALGVFFAIAFVSFLIHSKQRLFPTRPIVKPGPKRIFEKRDTFFQSHKLNKHLHLRYLVQVAILIEGWAIDFYNKFIEKTTNADVKNLCRQIAQEEMRHKEFFHQILSGWLPLPIKEEYLNSFVQELRMRGIFSNFPSESTSEHDMVKYEIGQEKKVADFYLFFENVFTEPWKKIHIQTIIMEERSHAHKLIAAYPEFKYLRF